MKLAQYLQEHGAKSALARSLDCPPQLVYDWSDGDRPVPIEYCARVEQHTEGAVSCEESRPDIPWVRLRTREWRWHPHGKPLIDAQRLTPRKLKKPEPAQPPKRRKVDADPTAVRDRRGLSRSPQARG